MFGLFLLAASILSITLLTFLLQLAVVAIAAVAEKRETARRRHATPRRPADEMAISVLLTAETWSESTPPN